MTELKSCSREPRSVGEVRRNVTGLPPDPGTRMGDAVFPHCHVATDVGRGIGLALPGGLRLSEAEILVRNEWRRRLGPSAYARAHRPALARVLLGVGWDPREPLWRRLLDEEVKHVIADLRAEGAGKGGIGVEMNRLLEAVVTVMLDSGVAFRDVVRAVRRCRTALEDVLGIPLEDSWLLHGGS